MVQGKLLMKQMAKTGQLFNVNFWGNYRSPPQSSVRSTSAHPKMQPASSAFVTSYSPRWCCAHRTSVVSALRASDIV